MKFSFIYWESFYDIRTDFHHDFDASGTSNAMFDELAERPLMTPLAGTKHTLCKGSHGKILSLCAVFCK